MGKNSPAGQQGLYALLLAAGESRRFGSSKALADWHGKPLVRHALETLQAAVSQPVTVVLGAAAEDIRRAAMSSATAATGDLAQTRYVLNPQWQSGMASSIASGLYALPRDANAVLIALVDQPLVTTADYAHLITRWMQTRGIVAARYREICGAPAIFPQDAFKKLTALRNDQGARALLSTSAAVTAVDIAAAAHDIDTPSDLALLDSQTD